MSYERSEFLKSLGRARKERAQTERTALETLRRSEVAAQNVTGDEHWDHFLSILTARLEDRKKDLSALLDRIAKTDDYTQDALLREKIIARRLATEIETLESVLRLPSEMILHGKQAEELLRDARLDA